MKIKKKKLIKYLKEWAKSKERDAEVYSEDGDYALAYEAIIIADFMRDVLIESIDHDFK
tara:strand:+ start:8094 stop:8270 length:177 start_codon:yes stop_codon:yes gene_type:complete